MPEKRTIISRHPKACLKTTVPLSLSVTISNPVCYGKKLSKTWILAMPTPSPTKQKESLRSRQIMEFDTHAL